MSMKKKGILVVAVVLLSAVSFAQAEEGKLSGTIDVTYLSSYIWRGIDMYPSDHSAIQPSINLDLYGTGFGTRVLMSRAVSGGFENAEQIDLTLHYSNTLCEGQACATNYTVGWMYYGYPDTARANADMQEAFASLSWPSICPAGVVPSYTVIRMWPSESSSAVSAVSGWIHVVGLGYDLTVDGFLPETPEQTLHLSAAAVFNDGVLGVDHDWSHAVFGVSTDFDLGNNLSLTPGVYYQSSWEDTVNTEDETWVGVSMKYKF